jgi:hypothetical protein
MLKIAVAKNSNSLIKLWLKIAVAKNSCGEGSCSKQRVFSQHAPYPLNIMVSGVDTLPVSDWLSRSCDLSLSKFDWLPLSHDCSCCLGEASFSSPMESFSDFSSRGDNSDELPSLFLFVKHKINLML